MSKLSMSRRSFVKTAAVTSAAVALSGSATTVALAEDPQAGAGAGEIKRIRTGCRGCESRCPFGVKIAERMQRTAALFGE